MSHPPPPNGADPPAPQVRIRISGRLEPRWSAWFDGLAVTTEDGTTLIHGPVADQAALHGLLQKIRDLGLPLLSVVPVEPGQAPAPLDPDRSNPTARTLETDMTITAHTGHTAAVPPATSGATHGAMAGSTRNHARAAGILYLITFASSIPAGLVLLGPVLDNPDYVLGAGADTRVLWGCLLDFVNALACVGTAVALFPVVRRRNESLALGFVASRMVEAAVIMIGVVSLLAVVTLRQDFAATGGGESAALATTAQSLVAVRDWTFLLGPGYMAAINAILLGTLMYRSRLVPRIIPTLGLIGAPLLLAANTATFFGHNDQLSVWSAVATLPVAAWELSLGIWMAVRGFRPMLIASAVVEQRQDGPQ